MEEKKIEQDKKDSNLKIIAGVALALFILAGISSVYLYSGKSSAENKLVKVEKELKDEKQLLIDSLELTFDRLSTSENTSAVLGEDIENAKMRISGLLDSLKTAENNVANLWKYKSSYFSIRKKMDLLIAKNDSLTEQNIILASTLDSTNVLLEQRAFFADSLLVQSTALSETFANAAVLNTVGLKATGVIQKSSGEFVATEKARRADKIKICFTVSKNNLVQEGDHQLYIQVVGPNSNTLGLNEQLAFDDQLITYSLISKFNYENINLDVCEYINPSGEDPFERGRYVVNVFNDKHLLSTSELTLK